jgi:hypothetical protein
VHVDFGTFQAAEANTGFADAAPVASCLLAFRRRECVQKLVEVGVIAIVPVKLAVLAHP